MKIICCLLLLSSAHTFAQGSSMPLAIETPATDRSWNDSLYFNEEFTYAPNRRYVPPTVGNTTAYSPAARANVPNHSPAFNPLPQYNEVYEIALDNTVWNNCVEHWVHGSTPAYVNPVLSHYTDSNGNTIAEFDIDPVPANLAGSCNNGNTQVYNVCGLKTYCNYNPYGYYEIRWNIPPLKRRYIAWWLTSPVQEIDIVELGYGAVDEPQDVIKTNIHYNTSAKLSFPPLHSPVGVDMADDYHTIGMEWTPKCIVMYFDGKPVNEILYDKNIPSVFMNMLMTPGVANKDNGFDYGTTGGYYIKGPCDLPPQQQCDTKTQVDFMKIHTLRKERNLTSASTYIINSANLNIYDPMLRRAIEVDGTTSPIIVSNSLTLRAVESVVLKGDVQVQGALTIFPHDEPINTVFSRDSGCE